MATEYMNVHDPRLCNQMVEDALQTELGLWTETTATYPFGRRVCVKNAGIHGKIGLPLERQRGSLA